MIDPASLPYLHSGERITAEHYQAVTAAARRVITPQDGLYDVNGSTPKRQQPTMMNRVQVVSNVDLPRGCMARIYGLLADGSHTADGGRTSDIPYKVTWPNTPVGVLSPGSGTLGYYTAMWVLLEDSAIKAGVPAYATLILPGVPFRAFASSGAKEGWVAGFGLSASAGLTSISLATASDGMRDFLCLSTPYTFSGGAGGTFAVFVWMPWLILEGKFGANNGPVNQFDATTNFATTGTFTVYIQDSSSTAEPVGMHNGATGQTITFVNRDHTLSPPANTYGHIYYLNNSWRPDWAAC